MFWFNFSVVDARGCVSKEDDPHCLVLVGAGFCLREQNRPQGERKSHCLLIKAASAGVGTAVVECLSLLFSIQQTEHSPSHSLSPSGVKRRAARDEWRRDA